jgi:hypothetical protein
MTKYRINKGKSRLTLCNSRASKETLRLALWSACSKVSGLPLTDSKGNYTSRDAKIWQRISTEGKRKAVLEYVAIFEREQKLMPSCVKWGNQ